MWQTYINNINIQIKQKKGINFMCVTIVLITLIGLIVMISGFALYGAHRTNDTSIEGEAGGFIAGFGALIIGVGLMIATCGSTESQS